MNPEVDQFIQEGCGRCNLAGTPSCKVHSWTNELQLLRNIALETGLTEDRKWGVPVYTLNGKNVFNISAYKDFATLGFFKGALLADEKGLLHKPGENSHHSRLFKFRSTDEIEEVKEDIKAYIFEAVENEKAGAKIESKPVSDYPVCEEFERKMASFPELREAFGALTPGRQKGYLLHFNQPKQSKTRLSRIEKQIPRILMGKGFHDRD